MNNGMNNNNMNNMNNNLNNGMNSMNNGINNMNNTMNNLNQNVQNGMNSMNNTVNNMNQNMQNNMNNMGNSIYGGINNANQNMQNGMNNMNNNRGHFIQPNEKNGFGKTLVTIIVLLALIAAAVAVYFLLIKNNTKVITCSISQSGASVEISMNFKNDIFTDGTYTQTIDGSSLSAEDLEEVKKTDMCSTIGTGDSSIAYSNCKQDVNGNKVSISVNIKPGSNAKKEDLKIDGVREEYEELGFTCSK